MCSVVRHLEEVETEFDPASSSSKHKIIATALCAQALGIPDRLSFSKCNIPGGFPRDNLVIFHLSCLVGESCCHKDLGPDPLVV